MTLETQTYAFTSSKHESNIMYVELWTTGKWRSLLN